MKKLGFQSEGFKNTTKMTLFSRGSTKKIDKYTRDAPSLIVLLLRLQTLFSLMCRSIIKPTFLSVFFMMPLTVLPAVAVSTDTITLCACPMSACAGRCRDYRIGECQQFDQCFDEINGIFGYVQPELLPGDEEVIVTVFYDENCNSTPLFDSSLNGWQGYCSTKCWSTRSMIGSGGCFSSGTLSDSASSGDSFFRYSKTLWSILIGVVLLFQAGLDNDRYF
jgi:hypothetical protein